MPMKHALVVDDSRSAQFALKKQLEAHELVVSLAASGEEALAFLEHQSVDVIVMDHTMPGMDGLQALAAIKRNPRTAMIPVMMYTTKEGEVYVGQARALGGIGVLPKDVQPHVLFDMLQNLGLVRDKRTGVPPQDDAPRRRASDASDDAQPRSEPPPGMALAALMNRIIEDQAALRVELRRERAALAREVANELIEAQADRTENAAAAVQPATRPSKTLIAIAAFFVATTIALATVTWSVFRSERAPDASPPPDDAVMHRAQVGELEVALHSGKTQAHARYLQSIDALQWALNQHASLPFDALPFDDERAVELRDLLERLIALGFHGRVRIESHLGEFCLVGDESSGYAPAPAELTIDACTRIGHPADDSASLAERQSLDFARLLQSSPLVNDSGIRVELVAHDRAHSLRQVPFPSDVNRADDWNRIAQHNNRLEYSLIANDD